MLPRALLPLVLLACSSVAALAEEPFLRPGDVIALVGGEDMVAASEYGYLELLLTRALPAHGLRFRCLAWEGDTVFEQRRDLNYPALEQQLDQVGATVVIAQFGQMESLAGKEKLPEFVAAYEKLIGRLSAGQAEVKRRVVLVSPVPFENRAENPTWSSEAFLQRDRSLGAYCDAIASKFERAGFVVAPVHWRIGKRGLYVTRNSVHLSIPGHITTALEVLSLLVKRSDEGVGHSKVDGTLYNPGLEPFRQLIAAKNRLWYHYYRPQNWAFLAGDRTNQPSSRDHLDREKRWFPAEMEQFLPLIAAKEEEIWKQAATFASKP